MTGHVAGCRCHDCYLMRSAAAAARVAARSPAVRSSAPLVHGGVKAGPRSAPFGAETRPATGQHPGWYELTLPFTRPLSMNDRQHWATRARQVAEWRRAAALLARQAKIPPCERIRVGLVYFPNDRRRRDAHNLHPSVKAAVDGLVDAGVVPDDTDKFVEHQHPVIGEVWSGRCMGRFLLVIEPLA